MPAERIDNLAILTFLTTVDVIKGVEVPGSVKVISSWIVPTAVTLVIGGTKSHGMV